MFEGGMFEELPVVGVRLGAEVLVIFSMVTRAGGVGFAETWAGIRVMGAHCKLSVFLQWRL